MQFHLYYGEGKGKTTAALGQALRAWGWGWRVLFLQFLKDAASPSGEVKAAKRMGERWRLIRARLPCHVLKRPNKEEREELRLATAGLGHRALDEMKSGTYELLVLDEVLAAWKLGLIPVRDIRQILDVARGQGVKLTVATGRWAPRSLLQAADVVTELREGKHHFALGGGASRGIEY